MNLFINSGDAMPNGGELSIEILKKKESDSEYLEVCVKDTGTGIPPDIQEMIFKPFFTTKPKGQGTGLGMYIISQIVRSHNGKIKLISNEDKGTAITITFTGSRNSVQGPDI